MPAAFLLDPNALLDFAFDWAPKTNNEPGATSDWLANGETITSFSVTADDGGVTITNTSQTNGIVTYWLSAGQVGTTQHVTCHITTSQGRQDDRTVTVRIVDR